MNYTIVWNKDKTEGIILSGEEAYVDAKFAATGKSILGGYSALAGEFYDIYGVDGECTIQLVEEIKQ